MNLFALVIGGSHEKSLVELHDVRFCIASSLEDTFEELRKSWWGLPETLHIDAWGVLSCADGHRVHIRREPAPEGSPRLFFVNLGGYDPGQFTELHQNVFVVAPDERKAKVRALAQYRFGMSSHRDRQFDIEHCALVDPGSGEPGFFVHLEATPTPEPFVFTCGRIPVGVP